MLGLLFLVLEDDIGTVHAEHHAARLLVAPLLFSHRGDSGTLHLPISRKTQSTMAEPSMSLHPPSTSHKAKPTTAATVAPKYHAAETMLMDIARWRLGVNSVMSEVAMG